jgi:hypothetical protein
LSRSSVNWVLGIHSPRGDDVQGGSRENGTSNASSL